jgi:hypothetical protein
MAQKVNENAMFQTNNSLGLQSSQNLTKSSYPKNGCSACGITRLSNSPVRDNSKKYHTQGVSGDHTACESFNVDSGKPPMQRKQVRDSINF